MMIDSAVFAYNTSSHESTSYSPFEVMFGRKTRIPINADLKSISELFSFIFVTEIFLLYLILSKEPNIASHVEHVAKHSRA